MKKKFVKRLLLIIVSVLVFLTVVIVFVPLFIFPSQIEGLADASEIKMNESKFINIPFEGTDGIEIHYMEKGQSDLGEPVFILLHGSMYNLFTWDEVFDEFSSIGRTIVYDQAPYGLSEKLMAGDWNEVNPYTQEAAIRQLVALLDALKLEEVYLVGSSYGGTLALRTAIEYKERVAGLILVDAAVFVSESMPRWLVNSPQMTNIGSLIARSMGSGIAFYENCYTDPSVFSGERKDKSMIMTEVNNWDFALWQYLKAWSDVSFDFESRIPDIQVPALVISGEDDKIVPVVDSEKLNSLIPNSKLHLIPEIGHLPHEEAPEQFLEIVFSWIDDIVGIGASQSIVGYNL